MKQVLQHVRSGELEVADVPEPAAKSGGVVVANAASLISAGTEKMMIDFAGKSMLGKARERPDLVRQVLDKVKTQGLVPTVQAVMSRLDQPMPLGYSCAGVVQEVGRGAGEFAVGDRVACAGFGYASHAHAVFVPRNLTVRIPDGVSFADASYVTLGAIALQGVRIATPRIGDTVVVVGLGLLGQLTVQILRASGCRVIGIDLDPAKVALAAEMGAELALHRGDHVVDRVRAFTGGIGADGVVITAATESNDPVELAGELCRDRGIVTVVGAVSMDVPRKAYYEKELELRLSRSYGPGRYDPSYEEKGNDYPVGYVRWTERRNLEEFLRLVASGQVTPERLTTHTFPIERAAEAYDIVTGRTEASFLGIVLTYQRAAPDPSPRRVTLRKAAPRDGRIGLGMVGAGNFARGVLLPHFARAAGARLVGVATATGVSGKGTAQKHGFEYCTTDSDALLADDAVNAVVVTTRHGSHPHFVEQALRAGKAVFVEKPLAIDEAGLRRVLDAQAETGLPLAVGFNRRFSPLAAALRKAFDGAGPLAITYRVNAGAIPADNWVHDAEDGGGRIVGEGCHFVDFASYLTGDDAIDEVFAWSVGGHAGATHDTVSVMLRYRGGSVATIHYFATGDRSFPKERVEVFGGGGVGVLDDFRTVQTVRGGKRGGARRMSQDKGFAAEVDAFLAAVRAGSPGPIPIDSLAATTRATFAAEESLRTGRPVRLDAE